MAETAKTVAFWFVFSTGIVVCGVGLALVAIKVHYRLFDYFLTFIRLKADFVEFLYKKYCVRPPAKVMSKEKAEELKRKLARKREEIDVGK